MLAASLPQALARRHRHVTPSGALTHVSTYLGTNRMERLALGDDSEADASGPMAYLVEQAASHTVEPHFHQVEQFQLFVGGSARIGTHAVTGVSVHYAGPHSPYGPIVAGPEGVRYVTLRRDWDPGGQWMREAAQKLRAMQGRRHLAWTSPPLAPFANLEALHGASSTDMVPPQAGQAGARLLQAGPSTPPGAGALEDRFWYVLAGSLRANDAEWGADACLFFPQGESDHDLHAGAAGVALVEARFPARQSAPSE